MTATSIHHADHTSCPGQPVLKLISGKWKPQIIGLAAKNTIRFNSLLKQLPGSSKQSLSVALRELEEAEILTKRIVKTKPLHIEYDITERGKSMISIFMLASKLAKED